MLGKNKSKAKQVKNNEIVDQAVYSNKKRCYSEKDLKKRISPINQQNAKDSNY